MSWNSFKKAGQCAAFLGYSRSGTITKGTHEGKAASITTGGLVKVGGANEHLRGVIANIDPNGDDISVQVRGLVEVPYTSTAPTVGEYNKLECGATGAVQIDATNGIPFFVESVNTTDSTCVIDLG